MLWNNTYFKWNIYFKWQIVYNKEIFVYDREFWSNSSLFSVSVESHTADISFELIFPQIIYERKVLSIKRDLEELDSSILKNLNHSLDIVSDFS